MQIVYLNDQHNLYEHSFNMDFLLKFHQHLIKNLNIDCHFVCEVINKKYFYILKYLFDGSKKDFDFSDCLHEFENKKINQIKNNGFKVVI